MCEEYDRHDHRGFTDQRQRVATPAACSTRWGLNGDGFHCYLCGHRFVPGDEWRWVYSAGRTIDIDGKKHGLINFMICGTCDGPDALDRWVAHCAEFYSPKFRALR